VYTALIDSSRRACGIGAERRALELHGAPEHQPRAGEQNERDGDFTRDERGPRPEALGAARRRRASRLLQDVPRPRHRGVTHRQD
jgi:hypothetical protein